MFETKDEQSLTEIKMMLDDKGVESHMFHEPDVDEYTSITTQPIFGKDRTFFKKFKMFSV